MSRVMTRRTLGAIAAVGVASSALVFGAVPALADTERRGTCSAGSAWEVDIEREYGVFGMDFEVKTQTPGESWRLVVTQNGKRIYATTRATQQDFDDRYADVDWEMLARDTKGKRDRFQFQATNLTTNEICRVTVSV